MSESVWILIISLGAMIGGAAIGSWLRNRLPEHHLADRPAGVIKSGMGLISTLAALILGLLISTAKISYDSTASQVSQIASDLVLLDQLLSEYGPSASGAREALRDQSDALANSIWAGRSKPPHQAFAASDAWRRFSIAMNQLPESTDQQRNLRKQIDEVVSRAAQARLRLFSDSGSTLPMPFLALLVFWLTIIFASYSILGETNLTVKIFVLLFALSSSGALFLISELNSPFSGLLRLSRVQISQALIPFSK
ncbi:bestrophin-like domain [Bradyrhizobium sp. URHC0002]